MAFPFKTPELTVTAGVLIAIALIGFVDQSASAAPASPFAGMQPDAARAFSSAFNAAAANGIRLKVNSAHRTAAEQSAEYVNAVAQYGSAAEARKHVLPPAQSMHVKGTAVDVASPNSTWLEVHGRTYGICRRYRNEPWHFEYSRTYITSGCPALLAHA